MSKPANRGVRGIRASVPGGVLIGRRASGRGAPEYLTLASLARALGTTGLGNAGGGQGGAPLFITSMSNPTSTNTPPVQTGANISSTFGEVALLSGIPANVLFVTLPIGVWDLAASVTFVPGAGTSTFTDAIAAISQLPNTIPPPPNGGGYVEHAGPIAVTGMLTLTTPFARLTITSPGPVWLVAQVTFT